MQTLLTTQDLSFVGYTYKNFAAVKGKRHSNGIFFLAPHIFNENTLRFFSFTLHDDAL